MACLELDVLLENQGNYFVGRYILSLCNECALAGS